MHRAPFSSYDEETRWSNNDGPEVQSLVWSPIPQFQDLPAEGSPVPNPKYRGGGEAVRRWPGSRAFVWDQRQRGVERNCRCGGSVSVLFGCVADTASGKPIDGCGRDCEPASGWPCGYRWQRDLCGGAGVAR